MYSAFAFSGACALVLTQPLARIAGFATLAQAFAIELLLFWFHLRMQSGLMADVHVCLIFAVAGCAVSVVAEAALCETGAVAPTLARSFFTILQGTWFCQAAHILYGTAGSSLFDISKSCDASGCAAGAKPWHADDMGNSMMLPVVFTAHVLGGACFHAHKHSFSALAAHTLSFQQLLPRSLRYSWPLGARLRTCS